MVDLTDLDEGRGEIIKKVNGVLKELRERKEAWRLGCWKVGRHSKAEDDNFADCIFCAPLILIQEIQKWW